MITLQWLGNAVYTPMERRNEYTITMDSINVYISAKRRKKYTSMDWRNDYTSVAGGNLFTPQWRGKMSTPSQRTVQMCTPQ